MSVKRKPTYDLDTVRAWAGTSRFAVTGTARRSAGQLGFGSVEMAAVIRTLQRQHFDKSITSFGDSREWQDVYHVPSEVGVLYVKFRADAHGVRLVVVQGEGRWLSRRVAPRQDFRWRVPSVATW